MGKERYAVYFAPAAERQLRKLPRDARRRVVLAIKALADDPRPADAAKLKGAENLWRVRVGDYRVIYSLDNQELVVLVLRVAHRKDAYRP